MAAYRPRWRADACGHVAGFAGQWAGGVYRDRDQLAQIVREMPNGGQVEIVEITDRVIPSDAAGAVDRFNPDGPAGYRANVGDAPMPLRPTRAEAEADWYDYVTGGDR